MCNVEAARNNTDVECNNGKKMIENIVSIRMAFINIEIVFAGQRLSKR